MTLDAACGRSKVDSTHDFPATLERHGRSFRHTSPWLTVEEFTREGARLFRRRVTGQASRQPTRQPSRQESFRVDTCARRRGDGRPDQSRFCFQPLPHYCRIRLKSNKHPLRHSAIFDFSPHQEIIISFRCVIRLHSCVFFSSYFYLKIALF
jgi:hypothetical protein